VAQLEKRLEHAQAELRYLVVGKQGKRRLNAFQGIDAVVGKVNEQLISYLRPLIQRNSES
jgi:hypothetical protein